MSQVLNLRPEWAGGHRVSCAPAHVLVIDDQTTARLLLDRLIRSIDAAIEVHSFASPLDAIEWARERAPDLVLTDCRMTPIDGVEAIRRLRQLPSCTEVPIMMVTVMEDVKVRHAAFDAGVTDFLVKPYDHYECRARCRNLLALREQHLLLQDRTRLLEREISAAVRELRFREREAITLAANLSEYHAHQDGLRLVRIARYARMIADAMDMPTELAQCIEVGATLLDVGKVGVPEALLMRDRPLTESEEEKVRQHTEIGHALLQTSSSEYLRTAAGIALHHHERYDGRGYPRGLKGRDIPVGARIVAVAEAFDRLTAGKGEDGERVCCDAVSALQACKGIELDPVCVEALAAQLDRARVVLEAFATDM
jgi:two-component system response regulator RpfG